jgi:CDP-paratose 2-epimerase
MSRTYFISGGAGFIGSNYADRLIRRKETVVIFDNLSRAGSQRNIEWLRKQHGDTSFKLVIGDVRDAVQLKAAAKNVDVFVHLAAQVAVTTSVINPREDFEINAQGTFNTLEAARMQKNLPVFIYASTNKVYGKMEDIRVAEADTRYEYFDQPEGIAESYPVDFHSPYGCSKGSGDQYVHDYARIYGIPSIVFRQSCIYGTRQFGIEDQGWVAWFVIAAVTGRKIKIYGDGKQVRDLLFVDDLLDAYDMAVQNSNKVGGSIFNIGGGAANSISIHREFFPILEQGLGKKIEVAWGDWRPGDQKIYVSDIRKLKKMLGWYPRVDIKTGIEKLFQWVRSNKDLF